MCGALQERRRALVAPRRDGRSHESAAAAVVLGGVAVNQLLLAQADELPGNQGVDALHGAGRRKRPARAALCAPGAQGGQGV